MTDTAWKPTPGRDAMTRDGDRVNVEEHDGYVWAVARDPRRVWTVDPATGRRYFGAGPDHPLDLVADWPDADPLPDADGWRKHTPGPCPVDLETEVEVRLRGGDEWTGDDAEKGRAWQWGEQGDGTITHYRIVRPAPSGPVVKETVKRAYNDDQRRALGCLAHSIISGEPLESKYCRAILDMMAELEQRAKSARQIGEAMEGK